ncbi:hypothetical protein KJ815_09690 [bacterium]|nr:hypothetical protein [bacterium]
MTLLRSAVVSLSLVLCAVVLHGADLEFRLITVKNVTSPAELAILRDELLLGSETMDRILITDALNDGFDENDMIQLYPSGRVLRLAPISARLDSLLRAFRLPPNVEIHETKQYFGRYDSLAWSRRGAQSLGYGILAGLSERLGRGYRGERVEGYFHFSPSGNSVMAWNFDSTKVAFPRPAGPRVDTVMVYLHDTLYVPEVITVTSDPVVVRDTVYIPSELLRDPRGLYYRVALGTVGGGYTMSRREASRGNLTLGAGNEWDFGVWDSWISGRQDIHSRIGLRFLAEMAPWKFDTLSPRFLSTSFETMFIPAWDRSFFAFGGIRAIYHDDLFWDRARAAWDEDPYEEPAAQDLAQYELTFKLGLDKFASYGTGKRFGAWLKLSGWIPGGGKSGYDLTLDSTLAARVSPDNERMPFRWEHDGGYEIEGAFSARIAESAQMVVSLGELIIPNLHYEFTDTTFTGRPPNVPVRNKGLLNVGQFYQTASLRFAPYNRATTRLQFDLSFRNNTLSETVKQGTKEAVIEELFYPYIEAPELSGAVQLDVSIVRFRAGARYYFPAGEDAQLRPEAALHLLFK